jgi:hypothetical protein
MHWLTETNKASIKIQKKLPKLTGAFFMCKIHVNEIVSYSIKKHEIKLN